MSATTCEHCRHWHPRKATGLRTDPVGECRRAPPSRDFNWPLTRAVDGCGQHEAAANFATGVSEAARAASDNRGGGSAGAVAPEAPRSTAPQTVAATPARPARAPRAGGKPAGVGHPAPLLNLTGGQS